MSKSASLLGQHFGQRRPPLSVTIKAILERYPDGQIFKVCRYIATRLRFWLRTCSGTTFFFFAGNYSECGRCWGQDSEVLHRQQRAWKDVARASRFSFLPRTSTVGLQRCAVQRRGLGGHTELAAQRQGGGSLQSGKIWNWIQLRLPHNRFIRFSTQLGSIQGPPSILLRLLACMRAKIWA